MAAIAPERPATRRSRSGTGRREHDAHLRLVIDTIPAMVWSLTPEGKVDFVNQRWLDYTGLAPAQALSQANTVVHPDDLPGVIETWFVNKVAGTSFEDEMRLRRADGEYRWCLVRTVPLKGEHGTIAKWYGTAFDIEDRKRADEALLQRKFDLKEAQRVARLGNWSFDIATGEVRWSDELYRIFEVSEKAFGGSYDDFVARIFAEDRPRVLKANAKAKSRGKPFEVEYRIGMKDGRMKHIREIGYARKDAGGVVVSLFGTAQDITAQKNAENALREAATQLQALSRRLVDLQESERKDLARELHDRVGQSLTALNINLEILRLGLPPGEAALKSRLEDSAALVESSMQAIGNVLSDLRPQLLDDHGLRAAMEWYAGQFSARLGICVSVRGQGSEERLPPDREIVLFRIAQEALNNVARHARAASVEVLLERGESDFMMTVTDDGVGLGAAAASSGWSLPGLGMLTMRERAQAVGGQVGIESLPERGTRLTVRIPR